MVFGRDPMLRLAWRALDSELQKNTYSKRIRAGDNGFVVATWPDNFEREAPDVTNEEFETFAECN
eukprot:6072669-Pyramimonas_sp.AAC.1